MLLSGASSTDTDEHSGPEFSQGGVLWTNGATRKVGAARGALPLQRHGRLTREVLGGSAGFIAFDIIIIAVIAVFVLAARSTKLKEGTFALRRGLQSGGVLLSDDIRGMHADIISLTTVH